MAILKCKMCGGNLDVSEDTVVAECEYCGTRQTVPTADNEKKLTMFNRANRLRLACEFDKAAGVYESIVAEFPTEAEAYWGLVLCRYGIEYVDDPATGKKIPTCHRSSFDSIMEDGDFEKACEIADMIAQKIYQQEARAIEKLRLGILDVSGKEDPYDIFICYKDTDENGERTIDSVIAEDVYNALTERGYQVFFSRISLEDKLGTEYEPYIFAALNSAQVMLVFGTDFEHFNAVWVKNEWSRFLALIAAGQKKVLIPCYKNVDIYDMPKEFQRLQAQDMGKVGAMQDLLRGIGKIVSPVNMKYAVESDANILALVDRGNMALDEGDWAEAKEYFDKALNIDAKCADAYLGLVLGELEINRWDSLAKKYMESPLKLDDNKNFRRARQFAEGELREWFSQLDTKMKEVNIQIVEAWKKEEDSLIAQAEEIVGKKGTIVAEKSKSVETRIDVMQGMRLKYGMVSPYFATCYEEGEAVLDDAYILLTDRKIFDVQDILPLLEQIVQNNVKLVILAEECEKEALTTLIVNKLRGTFSVLCIDIDGFSSYNRGLVEDIAVLTGGQVISEELGLDIRKADLLMLGRARKVIATKENTVIIGDFGEKETVRERVEQLSDQMKGATDSETALLQERISQLTNGVVVIRLSGDSETDMNAKLHHMQDTLKVRSEKLDGIIPLTEEGREEEWRKQQEQLIAEAIDKAGVAGLITVEGSKTYKSYVTVYNGMELDQGYLSPYLVDDSEKMESIFENPYLFITDQKVSTIQEILPILEKIVQCGAKLVIIAKEISDEVLDCLIVNQQRETFKVQCIATSGFGSYYREIFEDIAVITGGTLISEGVEKIADVELERLGKAHKVVIGKNTTKIIGGYAISQQLTDRINQISQQIVGTTSEEYKSVLHERWEKLVCGAVTIVLGADTETELQKRKGGIEEQLAMRLKQTSLERENSQIEKRRENELKWSEEIERQKEEARRQEEAAEIERHRQEEEAAEIERQRQEEERQKQKVALEAENLLWEAERQRIENERIQRKTDLENERAMLQKELADLKGLFNGRRRKEIENRLSQIQREINLFYHLKDEKQ